MKRRKKLRRVLLVLLAVSVIGFGVLWIVGPAPVSIGPYVQNVTVSSAEICWFSEIPARIEVTVQGGSRPAEVAAGAVDPATTHRVRLTRLEPGAYYTYTVDDAETKERLGAGSFATSSRGRGASFSFAAVGDSGKAPRWFRMRDFGWGYLRGLFPRTNQWQVGEWIAAARPDVFVHLGDIIYSHDQLPAYEEAFYRPFQAILRQAPLIATLGNHDMHTWEHPEFFRLFRPPILLDPEKGYRDFSHTFVYRDVRFLVLDAFWEEWEEGSEARNWLQTTLAENTLRRTIVITHSPPFSDEAGVLENPRVQGRIWPSLVEHGVDLVICGDSHNYQRFRPIDGVTLVIVGTGGKSIRPLAPSPRLAAHSEKFGFLFVRVSKYAIEGEFRSGGTEPDDSFAIGR